MRAVIPMIVLTSLCFVEGARGQGGPSVTQVQDLVKKVDAQYLATEDLQADFTQETRIEGFETPLSSSGRMFLKKPGLLRWDYVEPSIEHIYVNGDDLALYTPEHNQVVKGTLTQMSASKAPLALLQGAGKLAEQFDVTPTSDGKFGEGGFPLLALFPKSNERGTSVVEQIVLEIEPRSYLIKTIHLYEISGNISTLHFTNVRVNQGITPGLLQLDLPDDVVVVDAPIIQ